MLIRKADVEECLGRDITDRQYREALEKAIGKQVHIYKMGKNPEVMNEWYLAILTAEYINELAFSEFTMEVCRELHNMEKERLPIGQGTHTNNHIINVPAL